MSFTVFVGNLSWNTTDEDLQQAFGTIDAKVQRHEDSGRSKGWGLASFPTENAAANAVSVMNGHELDSRRIHVRMDRGATVSSAGASSSSPAAVDGAVTLFVGNLPWSFTDADLTSLFAPFNPITPCHVRTNMTGKSRGFALVQFRSQADAQRAVAGANGVQAGDRTIEVRVDRGPGKAVTAERRSVFVGSVDKALDDSALLAHMSSFGVNIRSCKIQRLSRGDSKGWAIVDTDSSASADALIASANNSMIAGTTKALVVRVNAK